MSNSGPFDPYDFLSGVSTQAPELANYGSASDSLVRLLLQSEAAKNRARTAASSWESAAFCELLHARMSDFKATLSPELDAVCIVRWVGETLTLREIEPLTEDRVLISAERDGLPFQFDQHISQVYCAHGAVRRRRIGFRGSNDD